MSARRQFPAWAAACWLLSFAAESKAYCLTRTCDPRMDTCEYVDGCIVTGKPLFWKNRNISFDVQKDGSFVLNPDGTFKLDASGQKQVNIDAQTLDTVVGNAFAAWLAADCGSGKKPSISVTDLGLVECAKPEYNSDQPNANIITFHDSTWPYSDAAVDTLALTTVFFDGESGEIYDSNIEINSNLARFSVGTPLGNEVDLGAVLTHEVGHFLGLSHNAMDGNATMFSSYQPGMVTLERDDEEGICASLPPDREAPASDDPTPRHGFSGECASPQHGCCATAVGANASPRQALAVWAFSLGLGLWRGRARFRQRAKPDSAARSTRASRR